MCHPKSVLQERHEPVEMQPALGGGQQSGRQELSRGINVRAKISPQESTKPFPPPPKNHPMNTNVNAGQTEN